MDVHALERKLRRRTSGEVRFDAGSRALYSTDASNYRQIPIGVVVPRTLRDVIEAVACAREVGAPIVARGGGTSLAGQCCNVALVIDTSKYLDHILWLDPARRRARVQPGVILDRLRERAEAHHLTFAPDPSTHNHCTMGGMIGNNSCGVHSVMGGMTSDNVEELDVLLYDGTRLTVGPTPDDELAQICAGNGRRAEIYR
ncbi:MAG TPA: FAD-binding oxidoreductase, partial [Myxococcales bacterium]|nr:FAD-binding oxidoreductase [Myxococcales bacterium]